MSDVKKLPARAEISDQYKWRLEDLFETDEAWEQACDSLHALNKKLAEYEGKISQSPKEMTAFFRLCDEAESLYERILVYSNEKLHQDMAVSKYQGYASTAQSLEAELMGAEAFMEPEILAMDEKKVRDFICQEEGLGQYEILINRILRKKAHTLSDAEEKLLAKTNEITSAPQDIFSLFQNADMKFGEIKDEKGNLVELTHGRYGQYMESHDRNVRKEAFQTLYAQYGKYRNTLAATYQANLKMAKFYADVRKYPSALEMELDKNQIPVEVYDNLIKTVHDNLNAMYRYVALRKKILGVEELHMYDVYARLSGEYQMEIPYEEAQKLVLAGLAPMGEEYLSLLKEGFSNQWIDVYENQGKRSGAYSWGAFGTHPYVLLNYGNRLNDVFTLAHEMGHALHTYYSGTNQPYTYSNYRIFVAEVASTCNESLLMQYLLKKCDADEKSGALSKEEAKKQKIFLLNYFIDQFKGTIYRQTMFAEFEKITHEMCKKGEALTAESLCDVYLRLNQLYFGKDMISDDEIALEWARIPHFYTPFYVYQYATGFSAAIALSGKILTEGESAVAAYLEFLKGGSSKDPIDLLKGAGVDLSSPKPVEDALKMFADLVSELEAVYMS